MTHRWDYKHPTNQWESWPWWFRWPMAVLTTAYFLAGAALPIVVYLKHK